MVINHTLIPLSDVSSWQAALDGLPYHYTHTHWYNQAMHVASGLNIVLYCGVASNFKAICPLQLRRRANTDPFDVCTPYGFSGFVARGECPQFYGSWCTFMRSQAWVCCYMACQTSFKKNPLFTQMPVQPGFDAYHIDLSHSLDDLFKQMAHGHRYALKKWQKQRVDVRHDKCETTIRAFLELYEPFLKRKQAASVYYFGEETLRSLFSRENVWLASAWRNNQCEAATIFIQQGTTLDYFLAASVADGQEHTRGMIWSAINLAKQSGAQTLLLGSGIKANDALSQFKARFGGFSSPTFALKQIFDVEQYQFLCNKYQTDPLSQTGYFPSYWQS